jgi:predicted DNA-binding protein (MmcQ/YjbR family)
MTKQQLHRLVRESRELMRTATPQQKIRLLRLIRESYQRVKAQSLTEAAESPSPLDYLDEK